MAEKNLPLKEISIKELYFSSNKQSYEVPIYQRNYAWEREEIDALVNDVADAFSKDKGKPYYIGTLVTYEKDDNVFEVIDGQQRLTTIYLILKALGDYIGDVTNSLTYATRAKSNTAIKELLSPDSSLERDAAILNGYKYAKVAIANINADIKTFSDYFCNYVHIIHYRVPKDVDLNQYFEIMNSRGEQLEKHEIVKARMIDGLKGDKKAIKVFNAIWNNCSDMGVYIQSKWMDNIAVFSANMQYLEAYDFDAIPEPKDDSSNDKTILEILNSPDATKNSRENNTDKKDKFQSIIDFPNFLLIILKLTLIKTGKLQSPQEFNLDDKELLGEFKAEFTKDKTFVKQFGFNLLKGKYLLDNYVVHHSMEEDSIKSNPWKLQYYLNDNKTSYFNLTEKGNTDNDGSSFLHQKLRHLLSMFEVSFTPRQRKNYLFYCLLYLFDEYDVKKSDKVNLALYADFVSRLASKYFSDVYLEKNRLNNINTPLPGSFDEAILKDGVLNIELESKKSHENFVEIYGDGSEACKGMPLFVFNYLDYKLWEYYADNMRGEGLREGSQARKYFFEKLGCSDFGFNVFKDFYFSRTRRSLEHYYAQARVSKTNEMTWDMINCLGNYAMIGSQANSSGSNSSPAEKQEHYLDKGANKVNEISVASLKFIIMMRKCKDNYISNKGDAGKSWTFEDIKEHQQKMLDFLF